MSRIYFGLPLSSLAIRDSLGQGFCLLEKPDQTCRIFLCIWFSACIISCCCRSRHTTVFSKFGQLVVFVIINCRSVEKFLQVYPTACSKSQLLSSKYSWCMSHFDVLDAFQSEISCPVTRWYFWDG